MTRHFGKWVSKQQINSSELITALAELKKGTFEAGLGGHLFKKRIRFKGKGKAVAAEPSSATKKEHVPSSSTALPKTKKTTYQPRNCWH